MKSKHICIFILLILFVSTATFSGCTVTLTTTDALQFNLSKPTQKTESLVAEFESGEVANVAGDVTQKAGSACVNGACIIY